MKIQLTKIRQRRALRLKQRGVAMPLVVIGLVAILAMAGLALDSSHALSNKTHLQNAVDAAALAAAKAYDDTFDVVAGEIAAYRVLGHNADGIGNHEMNVAYDSGQIQVTIQWSETLNPFVSAGIGPYVRVIARSFATPTTLSAVVGIDVIDVGSTAIAGPSPSIRNACNIAPMVVCAANPDDDANFGFEPDKLEVLKSASGNGSDIGPGNFQLIRMDCGPGGDCIRDNLAGEFSGCLSQTDSVETEPGNTVGPSVQGLNTRFGSYSGPVTPEEYPPDVVVTQQNDPLNCVDSTCDSISLRGAVIDESGLDYSHADYQDDVAAGRYSYSPDSSVDGLKGIFDRRVLTLPIASCDGSLSGQGTLPVIGFGCYFLLQEVVQKGTEAQIFGQFIRGCDVGGTPGPDPVDGPGPYIIQLYRDMASQDS